MTPRKPPTTPPQPRPCVCPRCKSPCHAPATAGSQGQCPQCRYVWTTR